MNRYHSWRLPGACLAVLLAACLSASAFLGTTAYADDNTGESSGPSSDGGGSESSGAGSESSEPGSESSSQSSSSRKPNVRSSVDKNPMKTNEVAGGASTGLLDQNEAGRVTQLALNEAKNDGSTLLVRVRNPGKITQTGMKTMVNIAGERGVRFYADNVLSDGTLDVRLIINPALGTRNVSLHAYTAASSRDVKILQRNFQRSFTVNALVVEFEQDSFGMPVQIGVRHENRLNKDSLFFYQYDGDRNSYSSLQDVTWRTDDNGFLYFTTSEAGTIVITDRALRR